MADIVRAYSLIAGRGRYHLQMENGRFTARHCETGETFRLMPFERTFDGSVRYDRLSEDAASNAWSEFFTRVILHPVCAPGIEWPVDAVEYADITRKTAVGWLFPEKQAFPGFRPIRELLYQPKTSVIPDWRQGNTLTVCIGLARLLTALDAQGWAYHDFNPETILYRPDTGETALRFTGRVRTFDPHAIPNELDSARLAIDFLPPWLGRIYGQTAYLSRSDDSYSVSALLFCLMIGRLPYEGSELERFGTVYDPMRDTDAENHRYYFTQYHRYANFIFSEQNDYNSLSPAQVNDLPRERWAALPVTVRSLFLHQFTADGEGRIRHDCAVEPERWIRVLTSLKELEVDG